MEPQNNEIVESTKNSPKNISLISFNRSLIITGKSLNKRTVIVRNFIPVAWNNNRNSNTILHNPEFPSRNETTILRLVKTAFSGITTKLRLIINKWTKRRLFANKGKAINFSRCIITILQQHRYTPSVFSEFRNYFIQRNEFNGETWNYGPSALLGGPLMKWMS